MAENSDQTARRNMELVAGAVCGDLERRQNIKFEELQTQNEQLQLQNEQIQLMLQELLSKNDEKKKKSSRGDRSSRHSSEGRHSSSSSDEEHVRHRHGRHDRKKKDDSTRGLKLSIPKFSGSNEPEEFLDWVNRVERVFACYDYTDSKKMKLAIAEFTDHANVWLDGLLATRRRNGDPSLRSWEALKEIMRRKYVPEHYFNNLLKKLQTITQGNRSIEEYHQEYEMLMVRAKVEEHWRFTASRFINGLNYDIQDRVEMERYDDMNELVHKATMVEQQLKRRGSSSSKTSKRYESIKEESWKNNPIFDTPISKKVDKPLAIEYKKTSTPESAAKGSSARASEIQCFKCNGRGHYMRDCPNNRRIVVAKGGGYYSEDDVDGDCTDMPKLEGDESDYSGEEPMKGKLLCTTMAYDSSSEEEKEYKSRKQNNTLVLTCELSFQPTNELTFPDYVDPFILVGPAKSLGALSKEFTEKLGKESYVSKKYFDSRTNPSQEEGNDKAKFAFVYLVSWDLKFGYIQSYFDKILWWLILVGVFKIASCLEFWCCLVLVQGI